MPPLPLLGIFVGGASSRMGGRPKGLLAVDGTGECIVGRLLCLAQALRLSPLFVGRADAYALRWPDVGCVTDEPAGIGPLGGLAGLLGAARGQRVLAVACDMPYVTLDLLVRFMTEQPEASVLAARAPGGLWDPLCARYEPTVVVPKLEAAIGRGVRSFQALFAQLPVSELTLCGSERAALADWDTPEDIP